MRRSTTEARASGNLEFHIHERVPAGAVGVGSKAAASKPNRSLLTPL